MNKKPGLSETAWVIIVCSVVLMLAVFGRVNKYRPDIVKDPLESFKIGTIRLLSMAGITNITSKSANKPGASSSAASVSIIRTYYLGAVKYSGPDCSLIQASNTQPQSVIAGQKLYEGDKIRTADQAELLVGIDGANTLQASPNSTIHVDTAGHENSVRRMTKIRLEGGNVKVKLVSGQTGLLVLTGGAAAYIRSGLLTVEYNNSTTRVASLQGGSVVSAAGVKVTLKQNQAVIIEDGKPPQEPFDLPAPPDQIKIKAH